MALYRSAGGVLFLYLLLLFPGAWSRAQGVMTAPVFWQTAISGFLAMAVGMTLVLFALSGGQVGVVTTLSSTSPILILPVLWVATRQRPPLGAWIAAVMVVIGSVLIFT